MVCSFVQYGTEKSIEGGFMKYRIFSAVMALVVIGGVSLWGAGPGEQLVKQKCTQCHDLVRVCKNLGKKDPAGWASTIDLMIENGATINENEKKTIAEYLAGLKPGAKPICK
jgi:hypothetical protein